MSVQRSFAILAIVACTTTLVTLEVGRARVGLDVPSPSAAADGSGATGDTGISFRGDYESGDRSQWLECFRQGAATCSVTRNPVRQGSYAGVFTTSPARTRGHTERAENLAYPGDGLGSESYYAWSTLFPRGFETPSWANVRQFFPRDYELTGCVQEHFYVSHTGAAPRPADSLFLEICAGDISSGRPMSRRVFKIQQGLHLGRWNDYVVHVVWSYRSRGLFVVWHRVQGRAWRRALLYRGPTLQYKRRARVSVGVSEGFYRSRASKPATIYQDGFVRGRSFAGVSRAAFGS
jgi:hypothetical protein